MIWLRVSYPRLREDQLQTLAWTGARPARARPARPHRRRGGGDRHEASPVAGLAKGLAVTLRTMTAAVGHRAVPRRQARAAAAQPRRHRAARGELHGLHAVRPRVPRLVHLHRLAQGDDRRRPRAAASAQRNVLDRFAIDFSLCMYCGICIEVCPFDALFWSPEFEYAEHDIRDLTHEQGPARASGCGPCRRRPRTTTHGERGQGGRRRPQGRRERGRRRRQADAVTGRGRCSGCSAWSRVASGAARRHHPAARARRALAGRLARRARRLLPAADRRVRRLGAGADLRRRRRRAAALRPDAHPGARSAAPPTSTRGNRSVAARRRPSAAAAALVMRRRRRASAATCDRPATAPAAGSTAVDRREPLPALGAAVRGALGAAARRPGRRDRAVPPRHRRRRRRGARRRRAR